MRYLKIFNSKKERNTAAANDQISINSVTIWGKDAVEKGDGKIEFGIGNGDHQLNLGSGDIANNYDDNDDYNSSSNDSSND